MSSSYRQELLLKIIFLSSVCVNMVDLGEGIIKDSLWFFKVLQGLVSCSLCLSLSLRSSIFLHLHNVLECTRMLVVLSQMDLCATDLLHSRLIGHFLFSVRQKGVQKPDRNKRCFVHPAPLRTVHTKNDNYIDNYISARTNGQYRSDYYKHTLQLCFLPF